MIGDRYPVRDFATRALVVAVRLLPSDRRDWGEAMTAELAAIDDSPGRRRHALGCAGAVLCDLRALRTLAIHGIGLAFAAVALVLAVSIRFAGPRIETIFCVGVFGLISWAGRRSGMLGPVGEDRLRRRVRGAGYAVLGGTCLGFLIGLAHKDNPSSPWIIGLVVCLYLAAVLSATTRESAMRAQSLRLIGCLVAVGLTAWWIPMLLLGSVRAHPEWARAAVAATVVLGLAIGAGRRWPARHVLLGGLGAGAATSLSIFVAAVGTYGLFPGLVPDLGFVPGMTPAGHVEQNRIESGDPYIFDLLLGSLFCVGLIAGVAGTRDGDHRRTRTPPGAGSAPIRTVSSSAEVSNRARC